MKRLRIKTMLMASVLVVTAVACTHLPRPDEKFSPGTAYLDWGKDGPDARDLARHTIEGKRPFEWWYFDGHLDTGETFVAVFHDPSFTNGKPGVTFSLYDPDWKKTSIMKALKPGELKSSTEDVDIIFPQGFIRRLDEKNYHLYWHAEGISADFKLATVAPGWAIGARAALEPRIARSPVSLAINLEGLVWLVAPSVRVDGQTLWIRSRASVGVELGAIVHF